MEFDQSEDFALNLSAAIDGYISKGPLTDKEKEELTRFIELVWDCRGETTLHLN